MPRSSSHSCSCIASKAARRPRVCVTIQFRDIDLDVISWGNTKVQPMRNRTRRLRDCLRGFGKNSESDEFILLESGWGEVMNWERRSGLANNFRSVGESLD